MSTIKDIKKAIELLPKDELEQLICWIHHKDWEEWNVQLEKDSKAGKLDFLINEATEEETKGTLQQL